MERNELEKLSLYRLRGIGREIGVKSPTSLKKEALINEIALISEGKKPPTESRRERRPYDDGKRLSSEQLKEIDDILNRLKMEIIVLLSKTKEKN